MNLKRLLLVMLMPLVLFAFPALAQDKTVTGKVTNQQSGAPMAGATVQVKGTSIATQTDSEGNFKINVPSTAKTLVISSVGFASQEVAISNSFISVQLTSVTDDLNAVVVIGYGTTRKKDLTGAVVAVNEKDFQKGQITTPEQLIAGKVAGVQISSNGGAPGAGSRIRIRGGASLNASNDPLLVIDGVVIDNGGIAGSANALNLINPNDIESFNILKDASATAIYGSRASNGVIIITTKKGRSGKPQMNFSTVASVSSIAKKVDVLSAAEFKAFVNANGNASQKARLGNANTDWQDEIYQTALTSDNNLSVAGSAGKIPYRASLGYLSQDGILKTGNLQRTTLTLNMSPKFFDNHLKMDINIKGFSTKTRFANEGAIGAAVAFDPTQPVYSSNKNRFGGFFEWLDPSTNQPNVLATRNPVGLLELREDNSTVNRTLSNVQFDYQFHGLPELKANLNVTLDALTGSGTVYVPDSAASQYTRGGSNNEYKQNKTGTNVEFYLNYAKNLSSIKSRIDVTAGYGYYDVMYKNFNFADKRANGQIIPGSIPAFPIDKPQYTLISYYGRLNYALMDKYLLTLNLRTDGSSRFGVDNRWGIFPSAAFAWKISDESFLKNSKVVSDLKLRLGYGVTGQQDGIAYYGYIPNYALSNNTAQYQFGNTYYNMYRPNAYDANLKWEQTENTNIGIDFGFAKGRISGSVDYYFKKTKDLLSVIPVPAGSNFTNRLLTNVGNMENQGVEFTLNTQPIKRNNLSWDFGFNVTYNKNRITNLTKVNDPNFPGILVGGIAGGTGNTIQINSVGHSINTFYVYKQVYDAAGKPIEGLYVDQNKDGIINEKDLYRYKSAEPPVFLGISSSVEFGKWSAGFVMRGSIGNYMYNNVWSARGVAREILNPANFLSNGSRNVLATNFGNNQFFSDYYVQNASFLRMDNINVGYNVGTVMKGKAQLRVNANIQNAFVITKYEGLDPEINGGIDNNFYPRPRVFAMGLNLNF